MSNLKFNISTQNGTGSTSANQLLTRLLFRSGWNVGSYHFFPSNIAGLSCLYHIRINSKVHTGFSSPVDMLISLNPKTFSDDLKELKEGGLLITDAKAKGFENFKGTHWKLPITDSVRQIPRISFKKKALFKNMVYLAFLSRLLKIDFDLIRKSLQDFFQKPENTDIIQENLKVFEVVKEWAGDYELPFPIPAKNSEFGKGFEFREDSEAFKVSEPVRNSEVTKKTEPAKSSEAVKNSVLDKNSSDTKKKKILIDGNTSSAIGALFAGCQFASWYPITPASSLAENFERLTELYQKDSEGKNKVLVLQAEDELAAISQVIGAGWAGLRAMTSTSGPGLSLMAEGAGLSYFAEVPAVICHVQRAGPSTGLPTRTQQSDLLSACFLSHGDSRHIVLLPGNPEECFQFTKLAFELAEQLQTLVIVLTDLDLGLNLRVSSYFEFPTEFSLEKQRTLNSEDLDKKEGFKPYKDEEGDGVSYRTLPGIQNPKGAYFTRGSGHNEKAEYSEKPADYKYILDKLKRKWDKAKKDMPACIIELEESVEIAFITFGANEASIQELREELTAQKKPSNYLRIRSFPFPEKQLADFLKKQKHIFVVEQNRDAQLKQLLSGEFPEESHKMISLLQYDGRPLLFSHIKAEFEKQAPAFLKKL